MQNAIYTYGPMLGAFFRNLAQLVGVYAVAGAGMIIGMVSGTTLIEKCNNWMAEMRARRHEKKLKASKAEEK